MSVPDEGYSSVPDEGYYVSDEGYSRNAPYVEKWGDELWIGVKGQTNPEIAGSLRNLFR